ncbi:MAG: SRPBCC family protein [Planctomycetes bacterium]|jgi:hypothetical protein|nr:SRPBCC family protein [Planctomycetota bacterium]MCL4729339.1 SRPBCC family protein [Planctomycetota bacterium]
MAEPKKRSSPVVRGLAAVMTVIALACGGVAVYGLTLDETHRAAESTLIRAKVGDVFARQLDVQKHKQWRTDVSEIRDFKAEEGDKASWVEVWNDGTEMRLWFVEVVKDRTLKVRTEHTRGVFYGTWTFTFEEADEGTQVTINEEGRIPNAFFRGMNKLVNRDQAATIRGHLAALKAACEKAGK